MSRDFEGLHDVWENQVRFEETDKQDVVFYGNYVTYQDETFSAFLREMGYAYETMAAADWDIHVVNVDLDYRGMATFGDELVNGFRLARIGESSMSGEYAARKQTDGTVMAEGTVTHVAVDESGTPTRIPEAFRERVREFQQVPPEEPEQ